MNPTTIDEIFGDREDPDSAKIVAVKFNMAKHPQN
jgi:hypothetical protein